MGIAAFSGRVNIVVACCAQSVQSRAAKFDLRRRLALRCLSSSGRRNAVLGDLPFDDLRLNRRCRGVAS